MNEEDIAEAAEIGRNNLRAHELLTNHCSHARIGLNGGTSPVGSMLGLPIGLVQVGCEYAPPADSLSMDGIAQAVEFYERSCLTCVHREPNGLFPTIATEAAERRHRDYLAAAERERVLAEALQQWERRHAARRAAVAVERYPVRDLADDLEAIDPRPGAPDLETAERRHRLVEVARRAPDMFNRRLADCVLDVTRTLHDPTGCTVTRLLARAGQVEPHLAVEAGVAALHHAPTREAGRLVAEFSQLANSDQVREAASGAVTLCADDDDDFLYRLPAEPAALLALSAVDIVAVTDVVLAGLAEDDEQRREEAAEAAKYLLIADPRRVSALGDALVASIRHSDEGYAGTPRAASSATCALAEAWRGEPALTRTIVEKARTRLNQDALHALGHVVWNLERWQDDTSPPRDAILTGIDFSIARLSGDWGRDVAFRAAQDLENLAHRYPSVAVERSDAVLGALLALCEPHSPVRSRLVLPGDNGAASATNEIAAELAQLDQLSSSINDRAVRREVANAVGHLTRHASTDLIPKIVALLGAESGEDDADAVLRSTLLKSLATAVDSETVAACLPVLYTSLLGRDPGVRADAITLWAAAARHADELPPDLHDLAVTLTEDQYVVVHSAMLDNIPRLKLPETVARDLLPTVVGWVSTYAGKPESVTRALENGIYVLLWLS